jgi:hypothetical protein
MFESLVVVDVDAGTSLEERTAYASAQQQQVAVDLAPAWRLEPIPVRVATPQAPPLAGEVQIRLMNQPTLAGALGYHDQLPDGTPIAYVFVGLARQCGARWESVASHEVCELLVDPYLRRCVQASDGFWDCEVADRVESDSYPILGVPMSNFNTPACFEPPADLTGVDRKSTRLNSSHRV